MYDFDKHLAALSEQTVLCIGDLMLDEFVYGEVSRISPEAPTPVIAVKRAELMIGGAGNVARNLVALGARCIFVGAVGDDEAGGALTKALSAHPLIEFHLVVDGGRQTTRKVRFVSEHHSTHLLRADWETPSAVDAGSEDALIGHVIKAMPRVGAVVLSDYAKGALTPRVTRAVIDAANESGKPVVVDPKGHDYSIYRGATLITPNRQELADATRSPAKTDDEIADAAAKLGVDAVAARAVLVTRSEAGHDSRDKRRVGPCPCLSRARTRCFGRRRHGRGSTFRDVGNGGRFRIRNARRQRRRRSGRRKAWHCDGIRRRAAFAYIAGGDAGV